MPQTLTPFADQLQRPTATARELGYRMPAEFEPLAAVWVSPPHNEETWPGCLDKAQQQFEHFMREMQPYVSVRTTQSLNLPTNDSWIRDYGPIFVKKGSDQVVEWPSGQVKDRNNAHWATGPLDHSATSSLLACHDFHFNGWGGKYEVRDLDDVIPQHVARHLDIPVWIHNLVLEGGSIDVNGCGTVMTTEQCLLNKNRNPNLTREQIIHELHESLGTHHTIWLPGGIIGDDTDGHIDDIARFVNPTTVVGIRAPRNHPDFDTLDANWKSLQTARDQDGRKLTLIELPVPDPILYNFPADRFGPGGENPVPASYANFLIVNGAVFVPIFGQKNDDPALRTLEQAMPGHKIIGIRAEYLVVGLGALHCLSQQQPA